MTLFIIYPRQYCLCCITGATRCTLLMVLFLDRICQCGLNAVLWSHIGSLMRFLAAEPRSTAGPLFPCQCPSGTILLALYLMVWDWRFQEQANALYWPKLPYPYYCLLLFFPFSSFCLYSIGWYCGAGVFGLIGCTSLSLSLALPTSFNNNNNARNDGLV